jgi:Phospholipase_D-nuclease N-terminal
LNAHSVGIAVIALAVGFVVFCLVDIIRAKKVRYLPKWAWAILCLGIGLTIPFGGIVYLLAGRDRRPELPSASG